MKGKFHVYLLWPFWEKIDFCTINKRWYFTVCLLGLIQIGYQVSGWLFVQRTCSFIFLDLGVLATNGVKVHRSSAYMPCVVLFSEFCMANHECNCKGWVISEGIFNFQMYKMTSLNFWHF